MGGRAVATEEEKKKKKKKKKRKNCETTFKTDSTI